MLKNIACFLLFSVLSMLILTTPVLDSDANTALIDTNKVLSKTYTFVKAGEVDAVKETYATYSKVEEPLDVVNGGIKIKPLDTKVLGKNIDKLK